MKQDAIINQLAHITGASRKQVIDALNKMRNISKEIKELDKINYGKRR